MERATLSSLATVATITLFLTGARTSHMIYHRKATGDVPFLPFLATFLNCCLWLGYGRLTNEMTVIFVNGIGATLAIVYIGIFYLYTTEKNFVLKNFLYSVAFLSSLFVYMRVGDDQAKVIHLGFICAFGSMIMFGSPLFTIAEVVRTKDTSTMSFPLCVMNFIVASLWTLFGLQAFDNFIIVPNLIGAFLSVLQLALFGIYGFPKEVSRPIEKEERDAFMA